MIRALALALFLFVGGAAGIATAQVSPGPLARAHADLEGTLKCTKCHGGGGADAMPARCLACHRDVAWLVERGRGFHGTAKVKAQRCAACHPDHAGADFQLVKWPEGTAEKFDHRRAGWALDQSHGKIACEKCHKPASRASPAAKLAAGGRSRWTGLETTCASCHEDIHRGALGERCTACHDAGKWAITPGFSHDTTAYVLTGRHRDTKCDQCHLDRRFATRVDPAGKPIPVYRPLPHQTCASCHKDVHAGRFGANCAGCHSTDGFKTISPSGFDHARTHFPLKGRHGAVKCAACHKDFTTEAGRRPASATCAACHADAHAGTATTQGKSTDCATCHVETGFAPSTFPLASHQRSRFPLDGKHAAAKCSACHLKETVPTAVSRFGTSRVVMRPAFERCQSCHREEHGGQLVTRADKGDCAACHRAAAWKPSTVDRAAHATLGLVLDGRHGEVACRTCHGTDRAGLKPLPTRVGGLGRSGFVFKGVEKDCAACHLDPHLGRFEPKGLRPAPNGCLTCHGMSAFRPAAVDVAAHQGFRLKLEGAHRATPCSACHRELERPRPAKPSSSLVLSGARFAELKVEAPLGCAACHKSVHGAQFDGRKDGGTCEACHNEESFAPAGRFDHDRDAAFALKGGHQNVPCASCHKSEPVPGGPARVIYRPLSGKCENCHTAK